MPPRPFPFPLRVGTDITSITRIRDAITRARRRQPGSQFHAFLDRLFTHREQEIFRHNFPDFTPADVNRLPKVTEHLAGRWAAKEAAIKASKPRKLTLLDIEVLQQADTREMYALIRDKTFVHASGIRRLDLTGNAAGPATGSAPAAPRRPDAIENDPPGQMAPISISHDGDYATAVCIAPLSPVPGDVGGETEARMYDGAQQHDDQYWRQ